MVERRASLLWFIVPVVLGLIGGIVGYFILKRKDENRANQVFLVGLFLFLATAGVGIALEFFESFDLISPLSLLT